MKLLLVGLDGLSFDIFEEFEMPFLRAVSAEGVRAKFIAFEEPFMCTGPVWASIQTGLPPEQHGVVGATAANWHTAAFKRGVKTIWRILNEKGITCGLVNFPVTYPPRPVERFVICGFPAPWEFEGARHEWEKVDLGGSLFWPAEVGKYVGTFRSAWMNYISPDEFEHTHTPYRKSLDGDTDALRYLMALLYRSLRETARLSLRIKQEYEVDLMASILMETDTIGHLGSALPHLERAAFLHEVDDVVRELFTVAEPENIIVMSDHGCWGKSHTREGIFLAAGPAFAHTDNSKVEVLEVAPTILYLWDIYEPGLPREPAYRLLASGQVGEKEQGQIRERLRAMGYLE